MVRTHFQLPRPGMPPERIALLGDVAENITSLIRNLSQLPCSLCGHGLPHCTNNRLVQRCVPRPPRVQSFIPVQALVDIPTHLGLNTVQFSVLIKTLDLDLVATVGSSNASDCLQQVAATLRRGSL